MSTENQGIGQTLYQDAASLGRFKALVTLILGSVICVVLVLLGVYKKMYYRYTVSTTATISQVTNCMNIAPKNPDSVYECTVALSYKIGDKSYEHPSFNALNKKAYVNGDKITIYIDPSNPQDFSTKTKEQNSSDGTILIVIGILILLSAYLFYWLSNRYTLFAAAEGTGTAAGIFKNIFN